MALCTEPCCNAEARKVIEAEAAAAFEQKKAAFEAWLAERDAEKAREVAALADPNDKTFEDSLRVAREQLVR